MAVYKAWNNLIREARLKLKITQTEVAALMRLPVNQPWVSRIERGNLIPTEEEIEELVRVLEMDSDRLRSAVHQQGVDVFVDVIEEGGSQLFNALLESTTWNTSVLIFTPSSGTEKLLPILRPWIDTLLAKEARITICAAEPPQRGVFAPSILALLAGILSDHPEWDVERVRRNVWLYANADELAVGQEVIAILSLPFPFALACTTDTPHSYLITPERFMQDVLSFRRTRDAIEDHQWRHMQYAGKVTQAMLDAVRTLKEPDTA